MKVLVKKRGYKRLLFVFAAVMLTAAALTGCAGAKISFSSVGSNMTIKVNEAEDGSYGESSYISVGKGRKAVIASSLTSGELKIDFAEAIVFYDPDTELEEVTVLDPVKSVNIGAGDSEEVSLEAGDYVIQVTAVGSTNGEVKISIDKT